MGHEEREPVSEEIILGEWTPVSIFSTLQEMYLASRNEDVRRKCRVAFAMAEAMCAAIRKRGHEPIHGVPGERPKKLYLRRFMGKKNLHGQIGICRKVQDIYLHPESSDQLRDMCRVAMRMTKEIDHQLRVIECET